MNDSLEWQSSSLSPETLIFLQKVIQTGREGEKIDLKQGLDISGEKGKAELAKDVSAIANTPGETSGYIILGVCDAKQRKSGEPADYIPGFQPADEDAFWGQANQALAKYLDPPPRIDYYALTHTTGKIIGIIEIHRSYSQPHAIRRTSGDIEEHQIWIRRGPFTFVASPKELEEMYRPLRRWILINFSTHPVSDTQREQIRCLGHGSVERVIEVPVEMDNGRPFTAQVTKIIQSVELTMHQWQTYPILISLPGFSPAAGIFLAQLHGIMGHFPSIFRVRPAGGPFEVAEVINLHEVREEARRLRSVGPKQ